MARYVAMIPARLGSKRVKKKNLRMLGDRPLIAHAIELALSSRLFDEVYVNSEADLIGEVAAHYGAKFYKRPEHLSSDTATNDDFALDFMNSISCDVLVQINPTSPLMSIDDLARAKRMFDEEGYDAVLAVKEARIEAVYKNEPVNWNPRKQMPPSQLLEPVYIFCNGILAWRTKTYRENMEKYGCAVYGGDGRIGYLALKGKSTVDIDRDEDFDEAEAYLARAGKTSEPKYWDEIVHGKQRHESVVSEILEKDGVLNNDLEDANHEIRSIRQMVAAFPQDTSVSKRVINSPSNSVTLISQLPGEGNRRHHHADWDEWWLILEGKWEYEIDGKTRIVQEGDLVFIPRNHWHKVTVVGDRRAIRMAVSRDGVPHIYKDDA